MLFSTVFLTMGLLGPGGRMPPLSLKDQNGGMRSPPADTRFVVVSFDKRSTKLVSRWVESKTDFEPAKQGICFMADIRTMPQRIKEKVFLPRLRKYSHPVLIIDDPSWVDMFPQKKGELTILELDGKGSIREVHFCRTPEDVVKVLEVA